MTNPTMPGIEVCELKGAAAEAVIREANGGKVEELSLVHMQEDEFHEKLVRAGLAESSERSKHRAELNR